MMENTYTRQRQTCRCCSSSRLQLLVNLTPVPIVSPNMNVNEGAIKSELAPLDIYVCMDCGFNQLLVVVDPSLIYSNYLYQTKISLGLNEHFKSLQDSIVARIGLDKDELVVEFGSNDGTLLSHFKLFGARVQGVDPAVIASQSARDNGIPTKTDFFTSEVAVEVKNSVGHAKVIISNNTMANIDNLDDIWIGVENLLADDGVFVFETQYVLDVYEKNLLDVIYHEHISYFSIKPLSKILPRFGLELFDVELLPTKGGSIRFWIQKAQGSRPIGGAVTELLNYEEKAGLYNGELQAQFLSGLEIIQTKIDEIFEQASKSGGEVAAYGTSVGCAALIHQFSLQHRIKCLFDDSPTKDVIDGPGYSLPVCGPDKLSSHNPQCVLILAWRYADHIVAKHDAYLAKGGKFFVVLPAGQYYDKSQ